MSIQGGFCFSPPTLPFTFQKYEFNLSTGLSCYQTQCSFVTSAEKEFLYPPLGSVIVICQLISEHNPPGHFFFKKLKTQQVLSLSQCILVFALKKAVRDSGHTFWTQLFHLQLSLIIIMVEWNQNELAWNTRVGV